MLHSNVIFSPNFQLPLLDVIAFCWFCACWFGYTFGTHNSYYRAGNLLAIMHQYRLDWMRQMIKRDNRIVDMSGVGNLSRTISFFTNTSTFLVVGSIGLMSYRDKVEAAVGSIPYTMPTSNTLWQIKVLLLVGIFMHAFFKYSWSLRQYNYITIYVGAAPLAAEHPETHEIYALRGAWLMTNAARHFNLGLRSYYYGFAAASWLFHPLAFIFLTTVVILVLYRREFHSNMYRALSKDSPADIELTLAMPPLSPT